MLRPVPHTLVAIAVLLMLPVAAHAQTQASITGVVKDASGAVLPGVTVEAASPALIEKVRVVVTDGTGQYRIEALRPGAYTVTFTLPGFSTVRRVGIELAGSFTATVNAELAVGTLEETITVSGESPVVDVSNTIQQRVLDRDVIDFIPAGRDIYNMAAATIPGLNANQRDVGGVNPERTTTPGSVSIHGSITGDQQLFQNGIAMMAAASSSFGLGGQHNNAGTQEVTFDTSAGTAEYSTGGVRINVVPRDGGNTMSGVVYYRFTNNNLSSSNLTDDLIARGLDNPNAVETNWEFNPGFGGPIRRDKLWFYASYRYTQDDSYVAGMYYNKNENNPNAWTYEPDPNRPAMLLSKAKEGKARITWQATPKNKFGVTWSEQVDCACPTEVTATVAPEAATHRPQPVIRIAQTDWTAPVTTRLLLEAGYLRNRVQSNQLPVDGFNPAMISVVEQSTGIRYRAAEQYRRQPHESYNVRAVLSYITGAHAVKFGATHRNGWIDFATFDFQPLSYRFNNGVPNQLTQRAQPSLYKGTIDHDIGVFAQDRWTSRKLTLSYGLRYDHFSSSFPETHIGPAALVPNRNFTFPRQDNLHWNDITPRLGVAYDLFGDGKTAIKASVNKYVQNAGAGQGGGNTSIFAGAAPANALVLSTTRTWNDTDRDFVPDCNLTLTAANGECGAMANANFGQVRLGRAYDPTLMQGWGARGYNWEFSAGVQRELQPRVALDVGYFRRVYGNIIMTDPDPNLGPADYDRFSITAPLNPGLPGGGGYVVDGLFNLRPEKFGLPATAFVTHAKNYGKQIDHWNGVDVTINARPRAGMLLQGGLSTGRRSTDNCEVAEKEPGVLLVSNVWTPLQNCHQDMAFESQIKLNGSYTLPRLDVFISAVYQNIQGPAILANYNAPNSVVAPSLGRNLSGGAANLTVGLMKPGTEYGERLNQLDLRVGKLLRLNGTRTMVNVDIYNLFNASPVLGENPNYAAFRRPTEILLARFVRLSAQFDF
jgi:hypothetical protein